MFEHKNLTDFEKLLFANKYIECLKLDIKDLKTEKGVLKSEIDELKYRLKQESPMSNKLHSYKKQIKDTTKKCKKFERMYENATAELILLKNN